MQTLVLPILGENLLRLAVSSVDVFMLSAFSDKAVAAVGLASQYVMFFTLVCSVVGVGVGIVIAQMLGARRQAEALDQADVGLLLAGGLGLVMSLAGLFLVEPILSRYTLETEVRDFAQS